VAEEWSLVAFTVIGQLAVGIYVFIGGPLFLFGGMPVGIGGAGARLALVLAVLGFMAAATVLSLFHLYHPVRAHKIFSNIGTSWLSREILFELVFVAIAGLLGFFEWRRIGSPGFIRALFGLGGLAGLLFILSMARLYMLPAVPAWNRLSTPASFFLTSLDLGALAATVFFGVLTETPPFYQLLLVVALVLVTAGFVGAALLAPGHGLFGEKPGPSLRPPGGGNSGLHAARLSALLAGAALLAAVVTSKGGPVLGVAAHPGVLLAAFFLAAAGEISGRFLFYGLPGRRS
jgi:anaerobic dimethyl sulfoxide reductase subunit C (anchor subunit)